MTWLLLALVGLVSVSRSSEPEDSTTAEDPSEPSAEPESERPNFWLWRYLYTILYGPKNPGQPQFLAYPVIAYAPETRLEFGVSGLVLFYSQGNVNNRLSEIPLYAFYTVNNQYGLTFEHAIFSNGSRRSYLGEGIIADFPLQYYGIGLDARYEDAVVVFARQFVARERVLFRLGKTELYFGPEVGLSSIGGVSFEADDGREIEIPRGGDGTTNLTAGLGLAYDTRHNPLNVRHGVFGELAILASRAGFLSEYTFHNVYADLRVYQPLVPQQNVILAGQLLGQFGGGELPFNELGLVGGESMLRGYYRGRYRDQHLVAAQAELRFLPIPLGFTDRIGAAGFVAVGTVYPTWAELRQARPLVTWGGGLRLLTFPASDIYTRIEVGMSEDGPGFYVYVGEAF